MPTCSNKCITSLPAKKCFTHLVIFGKEMTVLHGGPSSSSGSAGTGVGTLIDAASLSNDNCGAP